MKYVRNLTPNNVRVGQSNKQSGELEGVYLEPETVVTAVDPATKNRTTRPGENVANVPDEVFLSTKFNRSLGVLIEEITEDEYNARLDVLHGYHTTKTSTPQTLQGPKGSGDQLRVVVDTPSTDVYSTKILEDGTVKVEESHAYAGGELVTSGRKDPAQGGKTLTELRQEIKRDESAPGIPVDPSVLNQMGQGK